MHDIENNPYLGDVIFQAKNSKALPLLGNFIFSKSSRPVINSKLPRAQSIELQMQNLESGEAASISAKRLRALYTCHRQSVK